MDKLIASDPHVSSAMEKRKIMEQIAATEDG